ncbi:mitochondrial carrier [Coprinopsis marcescibilis]|uniref:Mitochondrial carrier n=1 Tax=Coprinopsis marcescibilis TaxID=230819 RepID=A0A5C3KP41_COPMA|nr:mitochondrial carrier [Coprinopsis marcescibilis]
MSQHGLPESNLNDPENFCGMGSVEVDDVEEDVFRGATKEIAFGSIAGMVSEVFEYPFDLAKVRLQAQLLAPPSIDGGNAMRFRGPMDCLMQTWKEEGFRGLYRGITAPIVGSMAVTAALFLSYASVQNVIRRTQDPKQALSMPQITLAGATAGAVASFVLTPIELVKCKMQVQMMNFNLAHPEAVASAVVPGRIPHRTPPSLSNLHAKPALTKTNTLGPRHMHDAACKAKSPAITTVVHRPSPPGAINLIRSIVATHGVRGLWLGHTGTLLRETGGCAAWFVVKESVARSLVDKRLSGFSKSSITKKDLQPLVWESALSGAMAGAIGAVVLYPADTVKSAIQTEEEMRVGVKSYKSQGSNSGGPSKRIGLGMARQGFTRTFINMYRTHGVRGLYAGCGVTVARAIPSSGIIFVVYDGLNNMFRD